MIKLGFVSAILADQSFEKVISFAGQTGYSCVEIMCWPVGKAERRYAGVTHIDVGYKGAACVEVEDRSYEGSLQVRKKSLVQNREYLRQFLAL